MAKGAPLGKGKGKGEVKGWSFGPSPHDSFPFPPPGGGGGKGPPSPAGWRKAHQASVRAAKDAEAAARLAASTDAMDTAESDVGSQNPGVLFGASRHNRRLASEVKAVNPEAASKLTASADLLFQRGQDAMPLAQQVASLERKLAAKVKEFDSVTNQLVAMHVRREQVGVEGAVLQKQLDVVKAKLVAAHAAPSPPPATPVMDVKAIMDFMKAFSSTLSQEVGSGFVAALNHIETVVAAQAAPLAAPAMPPPGRVGDVAVEVPLSPAVESPAPLGCAGGADAAVTLEAPTIMAASVIDLEAEAAIAAAASASAAAAAAQAPGNAVASGQGRWSQAGPSRARSRTHSPASMRSRVSGKAPAPSGVESSPEAAAAAIIGDGKRYFSDYAERAGLDDL